MKIAVGASSFASDSEKAIKLLWDKGIEVKKNPYGRKMTEEETIEHIRDSAGLLAGLEPLTERVFASSPNLKAVARIGIGMDNVDMEAARKHGVKVSNTPDGPTDAVAEMTLSALLSIARRIVASNMDVHNGVWKKRMGFSVRGKKVLVIGYGRIGKRTAELFRSFGMNVLVYDRYNKECCSAKLEECLQSADIISLHASGKEEILCARSFELLKDGAVILNSARGGLINEDALYEALRNGKVSWFWGDALWEEPYTGKLLECENAILTPHICTYTQECREAMETQAVLNLLEDLRDVL